MAHLKPPLLHPPPPFFGTNRFRWYKTPDGKPLNAFGYEAWRDVVLEDIQQKGNFAILHFFEFGVEEIGSLKVPS